MCSTPADAALFVYLFSGNLSVKLSASQKKSQEMQRWLSATTEEFVFVSNIFAARSVYNTVNLLPDL